MATNNYSQVITTIHRSRLEHFSEVTELPGIEQQENTFARTDLQHDVMKHGDIYEQESDSGYGQINRPFSEDGRVKLRSVFDVASNQAKPIIDQISDRDREIEQLMQQLAVEKKEKAIMQGAHAASLDRLRQLVANQGDLTAAEAAAESQLVAREMELDRFQREWESQREKLIVDLEEAIRQRDDSLNYRRELEQRTTLLDKKIKERSAKYMLLKEKYDRLKGRCRELTDNNKKMESYMCSLPSASELEKAVEENQHICREKAEIADRNAKLEATLASVTAERNDFETTISKQTASIIEMKTEMQHLQNELSPVLHLSSDRATLSEKPLEFQVVVYQKIVSDLEKEVEKHKQFAQLYENQLQIQKKCAEDLKGEHAATISKKESDIQMLQAEIDSKEQENCRLMNDVRKLQSSNQDHLVTIEDLKQKVRNFYAIASGDAGILHEDLVEKMYRCVDKCKRLDTALSGLIKVALPNKEICSAMARAVDVTEILSTVVPVVVFENDLDTSSKLSALLKHACAISENLDKTHHNVVSALAAVQAEAFPW